MDEFNELKDDLTCYGETFWLAYIVEQTVSAERAIVLRRVRESQLRGTARSRASSHDRIPEPIPVSQSEVRQFRTTTLTTHQGIDRGSALAPR
jgi:hypothetical protein